jgi:hypothetical protein
MIKPVTNCAAQLRGGDRANSGIDVRSPISSPYKLQPSRTSLLTAPRAANKNKSVALQQQQQQQQSARKRQWKVTDNSSFAAFDVIFNLQHRSLL